MFYMKVPALATSKKRSTKFLFFRKFGVLCFLITYVLRFALLSCYRRINEVIFMHVTNCNSLFCSEHEKFVTGSRLSPTIQVRYYSNFRKSTKTEEMNLELFQVMPNLNGNY